MPHRIEKAMVQISSSNKERAPHPHAFASADIAAGAGCLECAGMPIPALAAATAVRSAAALIGRHAALQGRAVSKRA